MKKTITVMAALLFLYVADAQNTTYLRKINAISPQSNLRWYRSFLSNKNAPNTTGTNETIIRERSQGALKVQVGANLASSGNPYSPNGGVRAEESGNITCTVQPKKINYLVPGDFTIMRQSSSFTNYPGDFVRPENIINASNILTPYMTANARNPYKIGISIFNMNGTNEITVSDFNTIPQAKIQDSLLAGNYGASIPAKGILEIAEIKSSVQLAASMEYSYGVFLPLEELGVPADITAGIQMEGSNQQDASLHYFLVSFAQPLYTLNMLTNISGLFANPAHLSNNSNGAYVSDVTYGRRALFIFAAADYQSLQNAMFNGGLNVAITGGEAAGVEAGVKAEGNISASLKASIRKFWGVIYGGSGSQTLTGYNDVTAFHQAFKSYLTSPSAVTFTANTGALPISYSLRRISDGAPISVRSIGDFEEKVECNTSSYTVDVNFEGFKVDKVVEFIGDSKDDIWGTFRYASRNTNGTAITSGNATLFNKAKEQAISRGVGQSYNAGDNPVRIIPSIIKADLKNTILNFSEDIGDWEPVTTPRYSPLNGSALQFNFSSKSADIDALATGQSKTYTKEIDLYEDANSNNAKVSLKVEIKIRRN